MHAKPCHRFNDAHGFTSVSVKFQWPSWSTSLSSVLSWYFHLSPFVDVYKSYKASLSFVGILLFIAVLIFSTVDIIIELESSKFDDVDEDDDTDDNAENDTL